MEGPLQLKRQPHGQRTSCYYKPSIHPWKLFGCDVWLNGAADRLALVAAEIVRDDDIAGPVGRDEQLLDIGQEAASVDRALITLGASIRSQRKAARKVSVRQRPCGLGHQPIAASAAAVTAGHVGLGPGLVDEDQAPWDQSAAPDTYSTAPAGAPRRAEVETSTLVSSPAST
jgi:hypothetical protein